jgi:hypothetical protein
VADLARRDRIEPPAPFGFALAQFFRPHSNCQELRSELGPILPSIHEQRSQDVAASSNRRLAESQYGISSPFPESGVSVSNRALQKRYIKKKGRI